MPNLERNFWTKKQRGRPARAASFVRKGISMVETLEKVGNPGYGLGGDDVPLGRFALWPRLRGASTRHGCYITQTPSAPSPPRPPTAPATISPHPTCLTSGHDLFPTGERSLLPSHSQLLPSTSTGDGSSDAASSTTSPIVAFPMAPMHGRTQIIPHTLSRPQESKAFCSSYRCMLTIFYTPP